MVSAACVSEGAVVVVVGGDVGGCCARHLHIGRGALGVSTDQLLAGAAVADGEDRGNKVEHFQSMRLVLVEEVHAVSDLHDVGAVRVSVVLQDKLDGGWG